MQVMEKRPTRGAGEPLRDRLFFADQQCPDSPSPTQGQAVDDLYRSDATADRLPINEEQARDFLAAFAAAKEPRPSIRKLAEAWCWNKSKVERLLSRVDGETPTEAPTETPTVVPVAASETPAETSNERTLIVPQREITIERNDELGEWILRQKNWPDDDGEIRINDEAVNDFLDALTDALGVRSAP